MYLSKRRELLGNKIRRKDRKVEEEMAGTRSMSFALNMKIAAISDGDHWVIGDACRVVFSASIQI